MSNLGGKNVSEDTDKDLGVDGIVAGTNIDNIDSTDPRNPIINASAGGGEVNTASNQGAGVGKVFKQKTGVDLELKSIKGGTDITISNDTSEVTINADSQLNNTTKGDLEGFSTVAARIPVGSNGQVLTADSAEALGLKWATVAAGAVATDVIWDAKGDLAGGTGADTAVRLAVGTNGQVLSADSAETTGMKWIAAPGGDPLTTKGDLFGFDTDANRIPVGTNGQVLEADSTQALGLKWATPAGGAAVFHGALVQEESDISRGSSGFTVTYDDEVFDTDGFATLGTDNDRFTIPSGVTKVQVVFFIDYTSMATTSNNHVRIRQFTSADVFVRAYDHGWVAGGDTSMGQSICTPLTPVSVGDYFTATMTSTDTSWTQTQVNFSIEYKDGTL